jgi:hypothetical protein
VKSLQTVPKPGGGGRIFAEWIQAESTLCHNRILSEWILVESLFGPTGFRQNELRQNGFSLDHFWLQIDSGRMDLGRITGLLKVDLGRMEFGRMDPVRKKLGRINFLYQLDSCRMDLGRITVCTNWFRTECI